MREHELKIWPPFFEHILNGRKTFDVRLNDRDFVVGDDVLFREYVPEEHGIQGTPYYTGRKHRMLISYILNPRPDRDPDCGLVAGYVVLGLKSIDLEARPLTDEERAKNAYFDQTVASFKGNVS